LIKTGPTQPAQKGPFWDRLKTLKRTLAAGCMDDRYADEATVRNKSVNGCFREKSNNPSTFSQIYK